MVASWVLSVVHLIQLQSQCLKSLGLWGTHYIQLVIVKSILLTDHTGFIYGEIASQNKIALLS